MTKIILQRPSSGIIKKAPVGFSWTTPLFWQLPALIRGDSKWFFIPLIVGALFPPALPVFPFIHNKTYLRNRLEGGYKVKSVKGATIEVLNARLGLELPPL